MKKFLKGLGVVLVGIFMLATLGLNYLCLEGIYAFGNTMAEFMSIVEIGLTNFKEFSTGQKSPDLYYFESLVKANLVIINTTAKYKGSGTLVKVNGIVYVLTCGHLTKDLTDTLVVETETGKKVKLNLLKIDKETDLAVYSISDYGNIVPLELSDVEAKLGSVVYAVGNPGNFNDIITEGIICGTLSEGYLFTNKVFHGNSGGALIYKGKVTGVVIATISLKSGKDFEVYSVAVDLKKIKNFMTGVL